MPTSFSKDKAHRVAVIGKVYGCPNFSIDRDVANGLYNNLSEDGTKQKIIYDKDNKNYKEYEQVAKSAKELGKADLIFGRTYNDRHISYTINKNKTLYDVSIGWWVVSKSWLLDHQFEDSQIIKLLEAVETGCDLNNIFNQNWTTDEYSLLKMLKSPENTKLSQRYFVPKRACDFVLNTMLNSRSTVFHFWHYFKDKCNDYLNAKSRVRRNAVDEKTGTIKTLLKSTRPRQNG